MINEKPIKEQKVDRQIVISDSDFLSSFIWADKLELLFDYPGRFVIPEVVIKELSNTKHSVFQVNYQKLLKLKNDKWIEHKFEDVCSQEYEDFNKLTNEGICGKNIDPGEAACIAICKNNDGAIIASNNWKDIKEYTNRFNIENLTTGMIIVQAVNEGKISEDEAEKIWADMILRKRKIGANSYREYVEKTIRNAG